MALTATETGGSVPSPAADTGRARVAQVEGYSGLRLSRPERTYKSPGGQEVRLESREHAIKPELAKELSTYLKEDLDKWMQIEQEIGPDELRDLLNESGHGYYNNLLDRLTKVKPGTGGFRELDSEKFRKYLATEPGQTIAYQVLMRKLQELALPAGVYLQMQTPGQEPEMVDNHSVRTGKGGPIREAARWARHLGNKRVDQNYGRQGATHGTFGGRFRGIQTVNDVLRWNAVSGAIGAALGRSDPLTMAAGLAAAPVATGLAYLSRRGETLNILQSAKALRGVIGDPHSSDPDRQQANASEVAYMQRFLKVDPHDIVIYIDAAGNEVVDIKNGPITTNIDNDSLAEDLMGYAKTIMEFQAANHIRRNQIEPMDIRWLIEGSDNPPQQGTDLQNRVMERFRELGGVRDMAGEPQRVLNLVTREWEDNAAYTPNNHDVGLNIATWNKAYTEILNEDIDSDFRRLVNKELKPEVDRLAKIKARKALYGPTSENTRNRITAITREQEALTAGRTLVEGARDSTQSYQEWVRNQRRTIEQNEATVRNEERRVRVMGGGPADVEDALEQILTDPAAAFQVRIGTEVIGPLANEYDDIQTAINDAFNIWYNNNIDADMTTAQAALAAAATPDEQTVAQQRVNALTQRATAQRQNLENNVFSTRLNTYNRRVTLVSGAMDRLRNANESIDRVRNELEERYSEQRRPVEGLVTRMQADRNTVEGWSTAGNVLDNNALATLEFAELQQRINQAYVLNPANGWPAGDNNNPANHERLVRAMMEARARVLEPRIVAPSADFIAFTAAAYGLNEIDYIALSNQEIIDRITAIGGLAVPTAAQVDAVRGEAQARMTARQRAVPEVLDQIAERGRQLTDENTRITAEGIIPPELGVIERASGRVPKIIEEITFLPIPDFIQRLDPANVGPGRAGYIAAEQPLQVVHANILRWVADTMNDTSAEFPGAANGREAAVARANAFLTPAVLNAELTAEFGVGLNNLQAAVQARDITPTQFANFLIDNLIYEWMEPRLEVA